MAQQSFFVPGEVPTLNELLDLRALEGRVGKSTYRRSPYAKVKKAWKQRVVSHVPDSVDKMDAAFVTIAINEKSKRRDPDGICSSAFKLLLDGVVEARLLSGDGWRDILGLKGHWFLKHPIGPGVLVVLDSERCIDSLSEMQSMLDEEHKLVG